MALKRSGKRSVRSADIVDKKRARRQSQEASAVPHSTGSRVDAEEPEVGSSYRTLFSMLKKSRKAKQKRTEHSTGTAAEKRRQKASKKESEEESGEDIDSPSDDDERVAPSDDDEYDEEDSGDESDVAAQSQSGEKGDAYERHFGEQVSAGLNERVTMVEEKRWRCLTGEDRALHQVAWYDLNSADETFAKAASSVLSASAGKFKVKKRVQDAWINLYSSKSKPGKWRM
ncbi:hypothetical protein THASP1DRAFT_31741 [Thamnocephalis sphaerospora]|uniref:Uncharacterized protein n=1 Tax=Thamnocephalis sphaerospora TaxID=78915 RepID=A0A4V1IW61_9FUNG|nr:hypothetical protein THASP1DRAFT_31741 [Thamnocephalis sphaerospora]|eukprot:RKP06439.1 hypothetical protein THASP1DRAFT_31741 [Thamnocephalis sphaerospora]